MFDNSVWNASLRWDEDDTDVRAMVDEEFDVDTVEDDEKVFTLLNENWFFETATVAIPTDNTPMMLKANHVRLQLVCFDASPFERFESANG